MVEQSTENNDQVVPQCNGDANDSSFTGEVRERVLSPLPSENRGLKSPVSRRVRKESANSDFGRSPSPAVRHHPLQLV